MGVIFLDGSIALFDQCPELNLCMVHVFRRQFTRGSGSPMAVFLAIRKVTHAVILRTHVEINYGGDFVIMQGVCIAAGTDKVIE